jgi:hypothetical protein
MRNFKFTTDTYIGLCAAVVALAALIVSVWQGFETRLNDRLSVRPYINFTYRTPIGSPAEILLHNKGIGPAILKKITYRVDGKDFDASTTNGLASCLAAANLTTNAWTTLMASGNLRIQVTEEKEHTNLNVNICLLNSGDAVSPSETRTLLSYQRDSATNPKLQDAEDTALRRITILVNYESIYGEVFSAQSIPAIGE